MSGMAVDCSSMLRFVNYILLDEEGDSGKQEEAVSASTNATTISNAIWVRHRHLCCMPMSVHGAHL